MLKKSTIIKVLLLEILESKPSLCGGTKMKFMIIGEMKERKKKTMQKQ
jgi:hypothetical protein